MAVGAEIPEEVAAQSLVIVDVRAREGLISPPVGECGSASDIAGHAQAMDHAIDIPVVAVVAGVDDRGRIRPLPRSPSLSDRRA